MARHLRMAVLPLLLGLLTACAAPEDAGFSDVNALTKARTGYALAWTRGAEEDALVNDITAELLSDELTLEEAVQVAVLNNRDLQATFEQLGIERAELIQAGLPRNPVFTGEWWFFDAGTLFEGVLVEDWISVITIPLHREIQGDQLEAAKLAVTGEVVHLVGDIKRAYFLYLANKQLVEMLQQVVQATKGSYMTATRLREAGNMTQFEVLRERALYEEAKVRLNTAVELLARSREQLNSLMGLWGPQTVWETPGRLPEAPQAAVRELKTEPEGTPAMSAGQLPPRAKPLESEPGDDPAEAAAESLAGPPTDEHLSARTRDVLGRAEPEPGPDSEAAELAESEASSTERFAAVERLAVKQSLELAAARQLIGAEAARLKLDPILAALPFLNAGVTAKHEPTGPWGWGPSVTSPVPVFDLGQAQVAEEVSRLRQRLERYAALATRVRATARAAEARLQAARSRALYMREVVLPLHAALVAEAQLQYNAMQITSFELLQVKLRQIEAGQQYITALLQYWMARADLEQLLDGALPPGILTVGGAPAGGGMLPMQMRMHGAGMNP